MKHCADQKQFSRLTQTDNNEPLNDEVASIVLDHLLQTKFFIVPFILAKIISCHFYSRNNALFLFFKYTFHNRKISPSSTRSLKLVIDLFYKPQQNSVFINVINLPPRATVSKHNYHWHYADSCD